MKMIRKQFGIFFLFLLGGIFFFGDSAEAFSIFPVRRTLVVDPGKTALAVVEIYNDEGEVLEVTPEVDSFILNPDTGNAEFGQRDDAKAWVHTKDQVFSLAPKEKRSVEFVITVPLGVAPESHYLGLFLRQKPTGGQVGLGKRVGTLLFLHVSGVVTEKVQLQDFSYEKKNDAESMHVQLLNEGSIHLVPIGTINFFNIWGEKVAEIPINPNQRKVLPDGVWRATFAVPQFGWKSSGKIRADLVMSYGLSSQMLTRDVSFWYVSWWLVGSLLGGMVVTTVGILFLKKQKRL